jgi:hypothetical protein
MAVKCKLREYLREAIETMPDPSAITLRMLNEKLKPKFGDGWEQVQNEFKGWIKQEAVKMIAVAENSLEQKGGKEHLSRPQEDSCHKKFDLSVSKPAPNFSRGDSSSAGSDCSDDFNEEQLRNSDSFRKKKRAKVFSNDEPFPNAEFTSVAASVQSFTSEVIRLKSLAERCG